MGIREFVNIQKSKDGLSEFLDQHRREIVEHWKNALKGRCGHGKSSQQSGAISEHETDDRKTLCYLIGILSGNIEDEKLYLAPILQRLRMGDFSIVDLYAEVLCLEESIESVLRDSEAYRPEQILPEVARIRKVLSALFETLLKGTSEVYEYVIESGGRGFCHVAAGGHIIYANKEMKRILTDDAPTGKLLESYFSGDEKGFVQDAVSGKFNSKPMMRRLYLNTSDGRKVPVVSEIAAIQINGQSKGAYACMVDISHTVLEENRIFDKTPLGILRLNTMQEITYMNQTMLDLCGLESWADKTLRNIISDDRNWSIVQKQLKRRFSKRLSDEYELEIIRSDGKRRLPVMVWATPVTDSEGNLTGTLAIIRNILQEKVVESIHKHIETIRDEELLLEAVAEALKLVVPYHLVSFSIYSSDLKHTRALYSYPKPPQPIWTRRWWELQKGVRSFIDERQVFIGDFNEILKEDRFKYLEKDAEYNKIRKAGFQSFIFCPIVMEARVVASVTLLHIEKNAYDQKHLATLSGLPLSKAVIMALYYEEMKELNFRLDLIKQISASDDIKEVSKIIVRQIADHYDWQNVALYRVDEKSGVFRLMHQEASELKFLVGSRYYAQHLDTGVLGYVYRHKTGVNIGNVKQDKTFKDMYISSVKKMTSELCLPIMRDDKVLWLLNIEDANEGAFSREEMNAIEDVLKEVSASLERSWLHHFLNATLESASDAVILTDRTDDIIQVNPFTEELFGYRKDEMEGHSFWSYFENLDPSLSKVDYIENEEVSIQQKNGRTVEVLLSGSRLPETFGGMVFIAKDLSLFKQVLRLKQLGAMYYEIASQTKTPLSLVHSWLRRLRKEREDGEDNGTIDRIIRQLRKVELSYDRLMLYDDEKRMIPFNEMLLDINEVLDNIRNELPRAENDKLRIHVKGTIPLLRGDIFQLSFCIQTILSYLLRFVPEEENIQISVCHDPDWIKIGIRGFFPELSESLAPEASDQQVVSQVISEIALGQHIIGDFIGNHGGKYHNHKRDGSRVSFLMDLPIAKGY